MNTQFLHLYFSSLSEVMFRGHEDYIRGINDLIFAAFKTDTTVLAYTLMSNHVHCCVQTKRDPNELFGIFKMSYGRYFSAKYGRRGYIGDEGLKITIIDGYQHCLAAISYCLRNPLHHGVTNSCMNYSYSSVSAYFRECMGFGPFPVSKSTCSRRLFPANTGMKANFHFETDGRVTSEFSVDYKQVEILFKTPNEFAYNMLIRKSGKKWREDQAEDDNGQPPVTLEMLESDYFLVQEMEKNERYNFKVTEMSDISICNIIDNELLAKYEVKSVYQLSLEQQLSIGRYLHSKYSCSMSQIGRCLAVRDDAFYRLLYR